MADTDTNDDIELMLKLTDAYSREIAKFKRQMKETPEAVKKDWDKLTASLEKNEMGVKKVQKQSAGLISTLGGMKTAIAGVATGFVVKSFADAGNELEALEIRYKNYYKNLGDVTQAEKTLLEVRTQSANTPFQFADIAEARFTLAKMTEGALDSVEALEMVGDAAADTAEKDIKGLATWISRAYTLLNNNQAAGEATNRLSELGVISVTTKQQISELQEQAKGAEAWDLLQKDLLRSKGLMNELKDSAAGMTSTIKDQIAELQRQFLNAGTWDVAKKALSDISEVLTEMIEDGTMEELGEDFADFLEIMKELLPYADEFFMLWAGGKAVSGISEVTTALGTLGVKLNWLKTIASPAGVIGAVVGATAVTGYQIYQGAKNNSNNEKRANELLDDPEELAKIVLANEKLFDDFYKTGKQGDRVRGKLGIQGSTNSSFLKDQEEYIKEILDEKHLQDYERDFGAKERETQDEEKKPAGLTKKQLDKIRAMQKKLNDEVAEWTIGRIQDEEEAEQAKLDKWYSDTVEKYQNVAGAREAIDAEYDARFLDGIEKGFKEQEALQKEFQDKKEAWELASIENKYDKEREELNAWYVDQIEKYGGLGDAQTDSINDEYDRRSSLIDTEESDEDSKLAEDLIKDLEQDPDDRFERERIALDEWHSELLENYESLANSKEQIDQEYLDRKQEMEARHEDARKALAFQGIQSTVGIYESAFKKLAAINSKFGAAYKVFAIAKATIDGIQAVQRVYSDVAYPYNIAAAIGMGAITGTNVAKITSTKLAAGRGPTGYGRSDTDDVTIANSEMVLPESGANQILWEASRGNLPGQNGGSGDKHFYINAEGKDEEQLAREITRKETYQETKNTVYSMG